MSSESDIELTKKQSSSTKKRKSYGRSSDVMKKLRLSTHETGPDCKCKRFQCFNNIPQSQIQKIINDFNSMGSVDEQNSHLCGLITVHSIKNRRPRNRNDVASFHDKAYSYKVRILSDGEMKELPVCYKAFISLYGITPRRLQSLQKALKVTGKSPLDMRGKYDHSHCRNPEDVTNSVIEHIRSFKGRVSHYSHGKTDRLYLPESLNIKKMHDLYKEKNLPPVSYEFFRRIFNTKFNIAFGYPRSDTCSTCDKHQADIAALEKKLFDSPPSEKQSIMKQIEKEKTLNDLHKRKAGVFYQRKRDAKKRSQKSEEDEAIAFDFQKNLSMPNISTNDIYYRRQLSFYSFNIHTLSTGQSTFYCYTETEGKKGSDEVSSFLHHFIFNILDHKVKRLEMFCDGCAGQNKNFTVLRLLHYVVHTRRLEYIKLTFPVRGHSYLECDRNMALVNQKYHAELPEHWIDVFENARMKPSPFNVIHVDQSLLRKWTEYLAPLFVKKCPFPTRPVKEIIFSSDNSRLVQYRSSYNGMWETAVFTPPNAKFLQSMMEQQNLGHDEFVLPERLYEELLPISWEKYTDIQHLKQFCSPSAKAFYESLKHK